MKPSTDIFNLTNPLDLFTSIHIHGLAQKSRTEFVPLTLDRSVSFPSPPYHHIRNFGPMYTDQDRSSRPIPSMGYQLEVRIKDTVHGIKEKNAALEGALGIGDSAFVYSLAVLSIDEMITSPQGDVVITKSPSVSFDRDSQTITLADGSQTFKLPPLCIKIAKPTHSRALAHEAWFYEQLDKTGHTGVHVPRSFGLFHTTLNQSENNENETTSQSPLKLALPEYDKVAKEKFENHSHGTCYLPEDRNKRNYRGRDNIDYVGSPWFSFREDINSPSVTVMILEQGGEVLASEPFYEEHTEEILLPYYCMRPSGIVHFSERFTNAIRAPKDAVMCPRHKRIHEWFYIDWEEAVLADNDITRDYFLSIRVDAGLSADGWY